MPAGSDDGKALEKLRKMISESSTFQTETGGSASAALDRIHYGYLPGWFNQSLYPRPLVMLDWTDVVDRLIAGGNQNFLRNGGSIGFTLLRDVDDTLTPSANYLDQVDFVSAIFNEVSALAGMDDPTSPYTPKESHLSLTRRERFEFGFMEASFNQTLVQIFATTTTFWWGDEDRLRN